MNDNLDDGNKQSNDYQHKDFQVINDNHANLKITEPSQDLATGTKAPDPNPISPNPITSESSYTEALSGQSDSLPPSYTKNTNNNLAELIIYAVIVLVTIGSVCFVAIRNQTDYADDPASSIPDTPLIKPATNTNTPNDTTVPAEITESNSKCESVEYQYQPTECKGYTISSSIINKKWKKYTINKYGISFEFPANLTSYGGTNNVDPNYLYEASLYPPDDNDGVISLSSSASLDILQKSIFPKNHETITLNTQMGQVQVKYTYGPYMKTGGTKYEYEFNYGDRYYYYYLFNISDDKKLMTTDEFKFLIESTTLVDSNNK